MQTAMHTSRDEENCHPSENVKKMKLHVFWVLFFFFAEIQVSPPEMMQFTR